MLARRVECSAHHGRRWGDGDGGMGAEAMVVAAVAVLLAVWWCCWQQQSLTLLLFSIRHLASTQIRADTRSFGREPTEHYGQN